MPGVQIRVLGPLDICLENGDVLVFESIKDRALLAYLAVEASQLHSRERLASLLWPDRPDPSALANLRHTLSSLRTAMGERLRERNGSIPALFEISPRTIQLNPAAKVWVDLAEFDGCLAAAEQGGAEDLQARILRLNSAVELYRGRFMDGFSIKGCPEFEDWMLLRRENTGLKFQKALRSLASAHEEAGSWDLALSALRQLLQFEPWDESAHRKLMALLAVHDQRSAAIGQYEQCRRILAEELGVEPEEETKRLFEQIRLGKFPQSLRNGDSGKWFEEKPGRGVHLAKPARPRFVGRQPQLAKLHYTLDQALEGHFQVAFITGEAGSGKTSLAWEFAHQALSTHPDLLVAAGRCNAITGPEDPYLPFREMVQMLVGVHDVHTGHIYLPEHLRGLTEAFPEIVKSLLGFGPDLIGSFIPKELLAQRIETFGPGNHPWQTEFEHIWDRKASGSPTISAVEGAASGAFKHKPNVPVARMLVELSRHRPLILFIDDLQWADEDSISLLHYLCKRLTGSQVVLIGAYRPEDVAFGRGEVGQTRKRHPLEPVRLELQREFGEMEVNLDSAEGTAFVDALVDIEPNRLGEPFRQTLHQLTSGNPLFVLELLRSMQERGDLVQDEAGRWVEGPQLDWEQLPARVEAVIAERIGRLPAEQQALLRAASVQGVTFTAEVMACVLNLDDRQVISWLSGPLSREQQIVSARRVVFVGPTDAGPPARLSPYRFSNALFQKYLYSRLDLVERSIFQEAIAAALERLYGPYSAELVFHFAGHF